MGYYSATGLDPIFIYNSNYLNIFIFSYIFPYAYIEHRERGGRVCMDNGGSALSVRVLAHRVGAALRRRLPGRRAQLPQPRRTPRCAFHTV